MESLPNLKSEFDYEYQITKRFLERFPDGKNDYAPHEKSMKMMPLATHLAEIFAWPETILSTDELDFGVNEYKPTFLQTRAELQEKLEKDYQAGKAALDRISEADLERSWSMKMNGEILMEWSKYGAVRHALNQITHHRAQLGTYYRMNEVALPMSYGPTADEAKF